MKFNPTLFSENPGRSSVFIAMLYVALCFSSCKHNDHDVIPDQAAFSVTNASPTKTSFDFYIDNQRVANANGLLFGNNTGYWLAFSGSRTASATVTGSAASVLHTEKIKLVTGRYHSIYVINSADTLSFLNISDDFYTVPQGKAQIRFINLSPDAPAYSLEYEGDTTAFSNRAFKEYTVFKNVPAKTGINLNLRNAASNAIVAALPNIELKNGETYTIWARGLANTIPADTVPKLKITRLIQHFQ